MRNIVFYKSLIFEVICRFDEFANKFVHLHTIAICALAKQHTVATSFASDVCDKTKTPFDTANYLLTCQRAKLLAVPPLFACLHFANKPRCPCAETCCTTFAICAVSYNKQSKLHVADRLAKFSP